VGARRGQELILVARVVLLVRLQPRSRQVGGAEAECRAVLADRRIACTEELGSARGVHDVYEFHIDDSVISAFYASEGFQKVGESGTYMDSLASTWPNAS